MNTQELFNSAIQFADEVELEQLEAWLTLAAGGGPGAQDACEQLMRACWRINHRAQQTGCIALPSRSDITNGMRRAQHYADERRRLDPNWRPPRAVRSMT